MIFEDIGAKEVIIIIIVIVMPEGVSTPRRCNHAGRVNDRVSQPFRLPNDLIS